MPPFSASLRLLAFVVLGTAALPLRAAYPPPLDVFPLDDARMDSWAAAPRSPVAITGRIRFAAGDNSPPPELSGTLVTAGAASQRTHAVPLAADGSFRLELPAAFPCQQVWFRVGRLFYAGLLVRSAVHLEIDAATRTAVLSGPDGPLNDEVRRWEFQFEPTRQNEIETALRDTSLRPDAGDFPARLATLESLHRENLRLLDAFAPRLAGYLLAADIDARFFTAVLPAARGHEADLVAHPLWPRLARHAAWAITNDQTAFYRALHGFLRGLHFGQRVPALAILEGLVPVIALAPPDARAAHAAALALQRAAAGDTADAPSSPDLRTAVKRLADTGWLTAVPAILQRIQSTPTAPLSAATREFSHVFAVPSDSAAATLAHATLDRVVTVPWLRTFLADQRRAADLRLAAVNATLAASAPAPSPAPSAALGEPLKRLPTRAALYRWPDLAGPAVLERLRAAFPDRALLLDFWGPWCSPCLEDLPHSRAAHAALHDKPIEFVYLACRTDPGSWQRTVADLRLGGTHVFLEPPQVAALMGLFGLGGFPGYAFIDRNGRHEPGVLTRFAHTSVEALAARLR